MHSSLQKGFSGGWERIWVSCLCVTWAGRHICDSPMDNAGVDNSFQTLSRTGKENYGQLTWGRSRIKKVCLRLCRYCLVSKLCPIFATPWNCSPPSSSVHGISQAKILEWVAHCLLQGIFLTQGSNLCLLYWQVDSVPLSPLETAAKEYIVPNGHPSEPNLQNLDVTRSQLFHSPLSRSSRGSLAPLHFLPLEWYHLHMWGCWYFSWQSDFSLWFI